MRPYAHRCDACPVSAAAVMRERVGAPRSQQPHEQTINNNNFALDPRYVSALPPPRPRAFPSPETVP